MSLENSMTENTISLSMLVTEICQLAKALAKLANHKTAFGACAVRSFGP